MPKTPIATETPKSNPFIVKSISKTLLTPCRQVGLSRKKKTPTSSSTENSPSISVSCIDLNTTPVRSTRDHLNNENLKDTSAEAKDNVPINLQELVSEVEAAPTEPKALTKTKTPKKRAVKRLLSEEDELSEDNQISFENKPKLRVSSRKQAMKYASEPQEFENLNKSKKQIKTRSARGALQPTNHDSNLDAVSVSVSSEFVIKDEEGLDDTVKKNSVLPKKTKKLKRCLSMKKSNEQQIQPIVRECSITLTPLDIEEDMLTILELQSLQKLENEVADKKKLINELKQAEMYKEKHNIKELEELTQRWKRGCIEALNDLLPQLRIHGDLDMEMLLKKLNIPEDKIRLNHNGDLC